MDKNRPVRIDKEVKVRLVTLAGELQAATGKMVSINGAIEYLLNYREAGEAFRRQDKPEGDK
jgi:hypothetical protein